MQVNKINTAHNILYKPASGNAKKPSGVLRVKSQNSYMSDISSSYIRANFAPLSFRGNLDEIKDAYILTGEAEDVPLLVTKENNSYVIDFDSQTEVIYGKDAYSYLKDRDYFQYDTQIIFPKKASGRLISKEGKIIPLPENSAVLINAKSNSKVEINKGYPVVVVSKKDYDWYERYSKDAKDEVIRNKFLELIYYNSHLYNAHFTPNSFLPPELREQSFLETVGIDKYKSRNNLIDDLYERRTALSDKEREQVDFAKELMEKMKSDGLIHGVQDGYFGFNITYTPHYVPQYLKGKGYDNVQISSIMNVYNQAWRAHCSSRFSFKNPAKDYPRELIAKLKEHKILHNNKKYADEFIYWREVFANEADIWSRLKQESFSDDEIKIVVENWKKYNLTGYDLSGLKYIDSVCAVYDFDTKLNNWTQEGTNWITNSTAPSSTDGTAPFVGISMVQNAEPKVIQMSSIRSEEKLHAHPNLEEKRQSEIYIITSGAAALNIVKDGKSKVKILKEGDLAVVAPGVMHSINSIAGEYEHVVLQVPSAFQYGFSFKQIVEPPQDYDEDKLTNEAVALLENYKKD